MLRSVHRLFSAISITALLCLFTAGYASAQVSVDQATGSDDFTCGPAALPCATVTYAVDQADATGADTVRVGPGTYEEFGIVIDFDLTIEAEAGASPIIDAANAGQHFIIVGTAAAPLGDVVLRGLTLQNGHAGSGGSINAAFVTNLRMVNMQFLSNSSEASGGAINASGSNLTIIGSTFRDNLAVVFGGAVYFEATDTGVALVIDRSQFDLNDALASGGAIYTASGTLNISRSGLDGNGAGDTDGQVGGAGGNGGAVYTLSDTTLISRSLFVNNSSYLGSGGAIYVEGAGIARTLTILNSTLTRNEADVGAALHIVDPSEAVVRFTTFRRNKAFGGVLPDPATITNSGTVTITTSIISESLDPFANPGPDCSVTGVFVLANNLIDGACGTGGLNAVTGLLPLANNGGPTRTHMLAPTSNAVDADSLCLAVSFDQRGVSRPITGCDIGSVEAF